MTDEIPSLPGIPFSRWRNRPDAWQQAGGTGLSITAGPKTDWFRDPAGTSIAENAPGLLLAAAAPCMLSARISLVPLATYDAGALVIYQSPLSWAKLALEQSPQGKLTIVSVVTIGVSDDCNSVVVQGNSAYLRVSLFERAAAFHFSEDAKSWQLIRYFALDPAAGTEVGFLTQSPTGLGCTVEFSEIVFEQRLLKDIRSGE